MTLAKANSLMLQPNEKIELHAVQNACLQGLISNLTCLPLCRNTKILLSRHSITTKFHLCRHLFISAQKIISAGLLTSSHSLREGILQKEIDIMLDVPSVVATPTAVSHTPRRHSRQEDSVLRHDRARPLSQINAEERSPMSSASAQQRRDSSLPPPTSTHLHIISFIDATFVDVIPFLPRCSM